MRSYFMTLFGLTLLFTLLSGCNNYLGVVGKSNVEIVTYKRINYGLIYDELKLAIYPNRNYEPFGPPYLKKDSKPAYLPGEVGGDQNRNLTPVVIIHGGGWQLRDIQSTIDIYSAWGSLLSEPGIRVFTVEHRAAKFSPFPAPLYDVRDAIIYLKRNAKSLDINPHKMILVGDSSGAHLAMLHGIRESKNPSSTAHCQTVGYLVNTQEPINADVRNEENPNYLCDTRVQAIANFYGPIDFKTNIEKLPGTAGVIADLFPPEIGAEDLKNYFSGQPHNLSADEIELVNSADVIQQVHANMPSIYTNYPGLDFLVHPGVEEIFEAKARSKGFNLLYKGYSNEFLTHTFQWGIGGVVSEVEKERMKNKFTPPKKSKKPLEKLILDLVTYPDLRKALIKVDEDFRKWLRLHR